ncbi:hypothetical protein [Streptomyces fractus]|uniref:hypothetical protein n=1 Tax=Streptomyces fractus TaxID=641806 RepID=UPI003CF69DC0
MSTATATVTARKDTVAAPGDGAHPFGALQREHASGADERTVLAHRGPSGLPWMAGTTSAKLA